MKKYCLLTLVIILSLIMLSACSNKQQVNETANNNVVENVEESEVEILFKEKYKIENVRNYKFEVMFESTRNFTIYQISNKSMEANTKFYEYKDNSWGLYATNEFADLDLFVVKDGVIKPFVEMLSYNLINIEEVKPFTETLNTYDKDYDGDMIWADKLITDMSTAGYFASDAVKMNKFGIANRYNLSEEDYKWIMAYGLEGAYDFSQIIIVKYDTEEQKETIGKGFDKAREEFLKIAKSENTINRIKNNERIYRIGKVIVWYCDANPVRGATDYLDTYFSEFYNNINTTN